MVQVHGIRRASADAKYRQMTGQPVKPLILKLCLPAVISNLVTTAYNLTDTFFIGQLGTAQSGAIGIAFSIMTVMQALGFFFGNGAGNSMSRELGKQNNDRASRLLAVGFAGAVLSGLVIAAIGLLTLRPLVVMLGSTSTIAPYAVQYLTPLLVAAPCVCGSFALNGLLRYQGQSTFGMIGLVSGALLNFLLAPLFIFVLHLGIFGAGLAAAIRLRQKGVDDVVVLEREHRPGGILRQCIHDGFGLTRFGETLSGPEYAQRFVAQAEELGITCLTDTTVLSLEADRTVTASGPAGLKQLRGDAVILTMGCRERTRGALAIPGSRPAGIYTAGVAQEYINLRNLMVGREVVILGSGDIGMIMARRMTLEGAHVKAVYEVQPYPSGLPRNIEQCLNDYGIPLYLSHTVTDIHGRARLEAVTVSQVDERLRPIPGTEERVECDTLILSVGLIPAGDIANGSGLAVDGRTRGAFVDEHYQTSIPGVFAAGNVLHVHDLVDFVSLEAEALASSAAEYLKNHALPPCPLEVRAGGNVGHVIPQRISGSRDFTLSLRVSRPMKAVTLTVTQDGREVLRRRLPKALPAEMLQLPIRAAALEQSGDLEVSVQ